MYVPCCRVNVMMVSCLTCLTFCVVLDNGHSHMDLARVSLWGGADGVEPWAQ